MRPPIIRSNSTPHGQTTSLAYLRRPHLKLGQAFGNHSQNHNHNHNTIAARNDFANNEAETSKRDALLHSNGEAIGRQQLGSQSSNRKGLVVQDDRLRDPGRASARWEKQAVSEATDLARKRVAMECVHNHHLLLSNDESNLRE